jgi:hypothetical protein
VIEFISVFPEIPFTVPSGLIHYRLLFICLCVLCSAICGFIKDKQIVEAVERSDELYESGL